MKVFFIKSTIFWYWQLTFQQISDDFINGVNRAHKADYFVKL